MERRTLDKLISSTGLVVAVLLLAAARGLFYAHGFIHNEVHDQLAAQKIMLPAADEAGFTALPAADQAAVRPYAGTQVTTGAQAEVFADHYIAVHLRAIGGGKTYSELSAASQANPSDTALADKVNTVFKGETLRGVLLNAYAFDTMATVAWYAALGAVAGALILLVLATLGFRHAARAVGTKQPRKRTK